MRDKIQHAGRVSEVKARKKGNEGRKCGKAFVGGDILWVLEGKFLNFKAVLLSFLTVGCCFF